MCTGQILTITVLENKRLGQIAVNSRWLSSVYTGSRAPRELETATLQRLPRSDVVQLVELDCAAYVEVTVAQPTEELENQLSGNWRNLSLQTVILMTTTKMLM